MKKQVLRYILIVIGLVSTWTAVQAQSNPAPVYSLVSASGVWSSATGVKVITLYDDGSSHVEAIDQAYYGQGGAYLVVPWWSPDGRTLYLPIDTGSADRHQVIRIDAYDVTTHALRTVTKLDTPAPNDEFIVLESISPDGRYVWVNTMANSRLLDSVTGKWLARTNCPSDVVGWVGSRSVIFEVMGCKPHFLIFDASTGQLLRTIPLDTGDYGYTYQWHTVNANPPYLVGVGNDPSLPVIKLDTDTGTMMPLKGGIPETPTATSDAVRPVDCRNGCDISVAPGSRALAAVYTTASQHVDLYGASGLVWSGKYAPTARTDWFDPIGWSGKGTWLFLNGMGLAVEVATGRTVQVPGVYNFINTSFDERWWVVNSAVTAMPDNTPDLRATLYDSQTGRQVVLLESTNLPEANFHWSPTAFYLWSPAIH